MIELGTRFGRLTVLEDTPARPKTRRIACFCDCGTEVHPQLRQLLAGTSYSCGCYRREAGYMRQAGNYKSSPDGRTRRNEVHIRRDGKRSGFKARKEYTTWRSMLARCYNPRQRGYASYGGRGITVCDRWNPAKGGSFEKFLADMGPAASPDHSLDRKDNDGPYDPTNCRWATQEEQANNKRSNVELTWNGKTQTVARWARELGVPAGTIYARLKKGWSVEDALGGPLNARNRQA